jgi:peptidoglycan-associated lipoprotein
MKLVILFTTLMAMLSFTACTTKEPAVEETAKEAPKTVPAPVVEAETAEEKEIVLDKISKSELEGRMKTVNFDFNKFDIRPDMEIPMSTNVAIAKGDAAEYNIRLEGNCDEWGSDEYNYALGLKRANAVKAAMVAEGVATDRISMVSLGETNPVCTDKTQECWQQNRRVDFKLIP